MSRKVGAEAAVPERQVPGSTVSAKTTLSLDPADRRNHDVLPMLTHEIGNQFTVIQGSPRCSRKGSGTGSPPRRPGSSPSASCATPSR